VKKAAFFLEGVDQTVLSISLHHPDEVFLKPTLDDCLSVFAKKKRLVIQSLEPLTEDSYRLFTTKRIGSIFSRKKRTYIDYVKISDTVSTYE